MRDVRLSGAKLKGAIIQARIGGGVAAGWSSMPQWRKYTEHPDLVEELGVAKRLDDN